MHGNPTLLKVPTREERSTRMKFWSIARGAAIIAIAAFIIVNIPDIKRYIRISTM